MTNASRTMLLNLSTLEYDPDLLSFFDLDPEKVKLPVVCSSSEEFGCLAYDGSPWPEVKVTGVLGDQQAALVGQHCLRPGQPISFFISYHAFIFNEALCAFCEYFQVLFWLF